MARRCEPSREAQTTGTTAPGNRIRSYYRTGLARLREKKTMGNRGEHSAPKIKSTAKVKCFGGRTCANCKKAAVECSYPSHNRSVRVSESYIGQLVAENKRLRTLTNRRHGLTHQPNAAGESDTDETLSPATDSEALTRPESSHEVPLDGQPWFVDIDLPHTPTPVNEAADTAFATRFRQVLSARSDSPCVHLPHIDYAGDDTIMSLAEAHSPWPKLSRARLLMSVAMMHASRGFHIVRRTAVLDALEKSFTEPNWRDPVMTCKLRALFALGDLCSSRFVPAGQQFPGLGHFAQATRILSYLGERPTLDLIEIRLLLSLYSFTLNRVYAAYTLAGTAVRMVVLMGLHLNIPAAQLSDPAIREHRNRVWWTAYIMDRMWASRLGCPPAIQDEYVKVDLPSNPVTNGSLEDDFSDSGYHAAYARLASITTSAVRSIYGQRDPTTTFLDKVQQRLKELKAWVEELPPDLHMDTSLVSSPNYHNYDILSLHLTLNQTIILATRPTLLYGLRLHTSTSSPKPIPHSAKTLIDACIRSARHSYRILSESWINGAFPALYHDLTQYLFSALTVLAVSSLLGHRDDSASASDRDAFEDAVQLLSQVRDSGNIPAREFYRHAELIVAAVTKARNGGSHDSSAEAAMCAQMAACPAGGGTVDVLETPLGPGSIQVGCFSREERGATGLGVVAQTAETALAEPSLQELLMQPAMEMQFLEPSWDLLDGGHELYWPEFPLHFQE